MKKILVGFFVLLVMTGLLHGGTGRYRTIVGGDGMTLVKDKVTGLYWQGEYQSGLTWQAALAYCQELVYGGYTDWKLPDRHELVSLVDYARYSPASTFPAMPSNWFWSSSSYASGADYAWGVHFGDGYVDNDYKNDARAARCVRP